MPRKNTKIVENPKPFLRLTVRGVEPALKKDGSYRKPRKRLLDAKYHYIEKAIKRSGGFISTIAKHFNVSWATMNSFIRSDKKLLRALTEEREILMDIAEMALIKKVIEGQEWAIKLYLNTQAKDRGYTTRLENTILEDKAVIKILQKQNKELTDYINKNEVQ